MDNALLEKHGLKPIELLAESPRVGMWKMLQPAISRTVLVHVFKPGLADDPVASSYAFSVIRAISNVNGPALADIYTMIDEPGLKAVVTEYVEGLTLEATIAALGPLSIKQVVRTGSAIAESLAALWNAARIVHGGVKAAFITLDAGSTAKLVSPCFARPAAADESVPSSDMCDLGNLLYFLATGVQPGTATSVVVPPSFLHVLQRLTSDKPMEKYTSWENVLIDLRAAASGAAAGMPTILPDAPTPAQAPLARPAPVAAPRPTGGRRLILKHAPDSDAAVKPAAAPAAKAPPAPAAGGGSAAAPRATLASRNTLEAVRAAAEHKASDEDVASSGGPLHFFLFLLLGLVLVILFVYRVAVTDPDWSREPAPAVQVAPAAAPAVQVAPAAVPQPAPARPSGVDVTVTDEPAPAPVPDTDVAPAPAPVPDAPAPAEDDAPLNKYLAAHIGGQVPFLYKGQQHLVTLVSYDADTITIKTRKTLTLPRAELSAEQRALWK